MTLPAAPTQWPVWAWDMYAERRAHRECEGETPSDAARNAEEDVRRWHAAGGDAAWVARLPAICPLWRSSGVAARRRGSCTG